jgi:hypothetical protein
MPISIADKYYNIMNYMFINNDSLFFYSTSNDKQSHDIVCYFLILLL